MSEQEETVSQLADQTVNSTENQLTEESFVPDTNSSTITDPFASNETANTNITDTTDTANTTNAVNDDDNNDDFDEEQVLKQLESASNLLEKQAEQYKHTQIDQLDEDDPISGQLFVLLSFVSPEGLLGCNVRGLKVRGVAKNEKDARALADKLKKKDKYFDIFIGEVGKWLPWDASHKHVKEMKYRNNRLEKIMSKLHDNEVKSLNEVVGRKKEQVDKESQKHKDRIKKSIRESVEQNKTQRAEQKAADAAKAVMEKAAKVAKSESNAESTEFTESVEPTPQSVKSTQSRTLLKSRKDAPSIPSRKRANPTPQETADSGKDEDEKSNSTSASSVGHKDPNTVRAKLQKLLKEKREKREASGENQTDRAIRETDRLKDEISKGKDLAGREADRIGKQYENVGQIEQQSENIRKNIELMKQKLAKLKEDRENKTSTETTD